MIQGHYSLTKAAHWLGLGTENLIEIATDESGRMIPTELEIAIKKSVQEGKTPFFVNATSGTTVLGAFDCLEPLADICSEYNLWLHVDVFIKRYFILTCPNNVIIHFEGCVGRRSFSFKQISTSHEGSRKVKNIGIKLNCIFF